MKKQRRNHSQEFKREAVALVVEHGYSCAAAGRSLGVSGCLDWALDSRTWQINGAEAFPGKGKRTAEQQRIHELETENRRLRMEKDILKKGYIRDSQRVEGSISTCCRACRKAFQICTELAGDLRRDVEVSPRSNQIMSANGWRWRKPLARFLTILTIRLRPSATALVTRVSTKARMPAWSSAVRWRRICAEARGGYVRQRSSIA